jgi:hypothetical protein
MANGRTTRIVESKLLKLTWTWILKEEKFIYLGLIQRYHTCQGASESTGGWCGPGMSFDTDNQRCDMALAINCKDGDRPDWKPPDNCKF